MHIAFNVLNLIAIYPLIPCSELMQSGLIEKMGKLFSSIWSLLSMQVVTLFIVCNKMNVAVFILLQSHDIR